MPCQAPLLDGCIGPQSQRIANQVVWKFDSALESNILEALKQAAIEEGQWSEKRDLSSGVSIEVIKARLNAGRQRVADAKKARDAKAAADLEAATKS